jgi:hypothetical protein
MTHVLAAGSRISTGQTGDVSADFEHLRLIDLPGLSARLIRAGKSALLTLPWVVERA